MNLVQSNVLEGVKASFENTYQRYLKSNDLPDDPIVKVGFYCAAEVVVDLDPIPDVEIQQAVLKHLKRIKTEAMDSYYETIELMFFDEAQAQIAS